MQMLLKRAPGKRKPEASHFAQEWPSRGGGGGGPWIHWWTRFLQFSLDGCMVYVRNSYSTVILIG